jgi:E3 ubiquitin-protein ligase RGLG
VEGRSRHFIDDNYSTLAEVASALKARGLNDCNLIVGIDFTKSNEWTGKKTFGASPPVGRRP